MKMVSVREEYSGVIAVDCMPLHLWIEEQIRYYDEQWPKVDLTHEEWVEVNRELIDELYNANLMEVGERIKFGDPNADLYLFRLIDDSNWNLERGLKP
jgi:hypothetical protein